MSKIDTWMPLYIGDYIRDTGHLTTAEHGGYLLLLMQAWTRGGVLPADDDRLRALARMDAREWKKSRDTILAFFTRDGNTLRQDRLTREIERAEALNQQRIQAGKLSAEKRATSKKSEGNQRGHVNDRSTVEPTEVSTNGQRNGRPSQPQSQIEEPSLRSGAADASHPQVAGPAEPPPDAKTVLFSEGLSRLRRMTGQGRGQAASLIGRLLKDAGDDCPLVSLVLAEAEEQRPADPVPWIIASVASRTRRGPTRQAQPARTSNRAWMWEDQSEPELRFIPSQELPH